jgi:hypothetical protein
VRLVSLSAAYFLTSMTLTLALRVFLGRPISIWLRLCRLSKRSRSGLPLGLRVRMLPVSSSENETGVSRSSVLQGGTKQ